MRERDLKSHKLNFYYYYENYYFCLLRPSYFLSQLENVILNNLSTNSIKIPTKRFKKYETDEFIQEFNREELNISITFMDNIVKYLEKNKFKLSKERKIEIFSIWFYWLSGTNFTIWTRFFLIYKDSIETRNRMGSIFINIIYIIKNLMFNLKIF